MSSNQKPLPNKFLRFSSVVVQMGVIIALFTWGGDYIDKHWGNKGFPLYTLILSLLGVGIALYLVIKEVMKISRENDHENN